MSEEEITGNEETMSEDRSTDVETNSSEENVSLNPTENSTNETE